MTSRNNEAARLRHAGQHYTAMDDDGPRIRIEAPGGRVVAFTHLPAHAAQQQLERIVGPFSSLSDVEQRIRSAFSSTDEVSVHQVAHHATASR